MPGPPQGRPRTPATPGTTRSSIRSSRSASAWTPPMPRQMPSRGRARDLCEKEAHHRRGPAAAMVYAEAASEAAAEAALGLEPGQQPEFDSPSSRPILAGRQLDP